MVDRPLVVVYGDSLLMEGVAVSLAGCQKLSIVRLDSYAIDVLQQVKALDPDVFIFELKILHSPLILWLLKENSRTFLIGLDLACSCVIVLSSRRHITHSMHDLYQVVEEEVDAQVHSSYEKEPASSLALIGDSRSPFPNR